MQRRKTLEISKNFGKSIISQNKSAEVYLIIHHKLFEKEILRIPKHIQQKTYRILASIKSNPISLAPNTTSFKGYKNTYRTRIGKYRLVYQIRNNEKIIFVLGIDTRGEVYKILGRLLN